MSLKEKKFISRVKGLFDSVSVDEKISGKMVAMLSVMLISSLMIVICIITLSQELIEDDNRTAEVTTAVPDTSVPETSPAVTTEEKVTTVSEYVLNTPLINQFEYQQLVEAENAEKTEAPVVSTERAGFSGTGFLRGFAANGTDTVKFTFEIPSSQHYDISICFASDAVVRNEVYMNDRRLFDFACTQETVGKFVVKTYYGVYLDAGQVIMSVHDGEGGFDLDYMKIQNNQSIYAAGTDIVPSLINPEASPEANELMKYFAENFGKKIITGQYVSGTDNIEINKIYENTSNYPAIRFSDIGMYSEKNADSTVEDEIEASLKWAKQGGIVGYVWHWKAPMNTPDIYSKNTEFNLANAMTDKDIALLSPEKLQNLCNNGEITPECLAIIKDIDAVSIQLKKLCDKGIPVLWRPLHEAGGDWFWWGSAGPDAYKWLWDLVYRRQAQYHKLNNLIWIWSAQGTQYFAGNSMFDIAAVDLYDENTDNTSYYKQYQWIYSLTGGQKLIALSECGMLPDMELTFRDRAVWSFFGLWYGDYILDKNGELSEKYNSRDSLVKMYNSDRTITLEKYKNRNILKAADTTNEAVTTTVVTEAMTEPVTPVTEVPAAQ